MNNSGFITIELDKRLRERFKEKCKKQSITVQRAIPLLMEKVVSGQVSFSPIKRDVLVLNKKR